MTIEEDKRIRPYCVALSQIALAPDGIFDGNSSRTTQALKDLYTHFDHVIRPDSQISANLADYVFVPLSYLLKQPKLGDVQLELLLKILSLLIKHCWTTPKSIPYVLAKQLFPLITFLTGGSPNTEDKTEIKSKSSELKLAGSIALEYFFHSLSKQKDAKVFDFFSNVENLPALGHAVTVLLYFAEHGQSVELQLQAIKTLDTLFFKLIKDGEILSYILPGNVSTLTKIIAVPALKTHYTVMIDAITLLGDLLIMVYKDEELKPKINELESIEDALEGTELDVITIEEADLKKVHRTNAWLKATSSQVKIALQSFKKIGFNVRVEVKKTLLTFSQSLLKHCLFSLKSSIPIVVSMISFLSNDPRLKIEPNKTLSLSDTKNQQILNKIISSELDSSVNSFISVIQSPNEERIINTLGAIEFSLRHSYDQLLVKKLIETTRIEMADMLRKTCSKSKVQSISNGAIDLMVISKEVSEFPSDTKLSSIFGKIFSEKVENKLSHLYNIIGSLSDPSENIEELLVDDYGTNYEKAIALWISNNLLNGHFEKSRPERIADEFLDFEEEEMALQETPESAYLVLDYSKRILENIPEFELSQELELVSSIAVDSVGIAAYHLREEFRFELVDYLYPVIDSLASPSETVRKHASNTSMIIADTLYRGSLYELILVNADYLVDAVSIRLSNAMTTRATAILAVCVKIAGYKIIETFKDVLEIIFSLLDYYHGYDDLCIGFFMLFEIVADEINKKYLHDYDTQKLEYFESSSTYSPWGLKNLNQLKNLLDKSQREVIIEEKPQETEDDVEDEINAQDSDDEDLPEDVIPKVEEKKWISPIPEDAYKLLQQVVYYGERLLTHNSVKLHIQILRTYEKIVPILATAPDNLHPITASIWPVMCQQVNNSDPKIIIPGSKVLSQLLKYNKGFLSTRFTEFWSILKNNNLLRSANKSISETQKVVLPGLNSKAYESIVNMLIAGLDSMGRYIPDSITEEIIKTCVGVVPDIERFGMSSDIAWSIKDELYGSLKADQKPSNVEASSGTTYAFV
ncbi:hypothetical protein BN7_6239 [Wickerhamomyces ciferrii]|uniref:TEL2-interacting protein 1 n=1 Tax=Wickerhamomyces ciferrii (strain ATCC 14091 / BCRC 22168 / CBS 111 / JCM 3599 / NBRC 0793 / NRRL Y-1031 F-60-10) TaxID=1206466 RepID=K0KZ45_WICCF|nr:uncharacterized protein BN7_6239 [Wickerhamomyces ciferrii]CCH46644.1 hypothetical protein BN7_6239 [Wickerhamomyces ciferrii]